MSEPIKAGDLVMVVRPYCLCGTGIAIGRIFAVKRLKALPQVLCSQCKTIRPEVAAYTGGTVKSGAPEVIPVYALKRIPPLGELEGEQRKEELNRMISARPFAL